MLIGYARVSTSEQNLDLQRDALTHAVCLKIFEDTISGTRVARPGLTSNQLLRQPPESKPSASIARCCKLAFWSLDWFLRWCLPVVGRRTTRRSNGRAVRHRPK